MNEKTLYKLIGELDESLLDESEQPFSKNAKLVRFKTGRTLLIAAIIACMGAVTVYAVGSVLFMNEGKIPFFKDKTQSSQSNESLETVRGSYDAMQTDLESFTTPVGQSSTSNGITITLDDLSMDAAGLDVFMTISGEEAIQQLLNESPNPQNWATFFGELPTFHRAKVNGKRILWEDTKDWYLAGDGTIKMWQHYLLEFLPKGDTLKIELFDDSVLNRSGEWGFEVTLDGKSIRTGCKAAKPESWSIEGIEEENETFEIKYLAVGPKGGVLRCDDWREESLQAVDFYIRDDTGKEIYLSNESTGAQESIWNLSAAAPSAGAITFTPVKVTGSQKTCTVTTEQLKQGVRLEFNSLGGYTVQNFKIEGSSICYELVPYGWNPIRGEHLLPETPAGAEFGAHQGVLSDTVDPRTGVIQERFDFYTATEQDLNKITEWTFRWQSAELLEDQAVTAELFEIESET